MIFGRKINKDRFIGESYNEMKNKDLNKEFCLKDKLKKAWDTDVNNFKKRKKIKKNQPMTFKTRLSDRWGF